MPKLRKAEALAKHDADYRWMAGVFSMGGLRFIPIYREPRYILQMQFVTGRKKEVISRVSLILRHKVQTRRKNGREQYFITVHGRKADLLMVELRTLGLTNTAWRDYRIAVRSVEDKNTELHLQKVHRSTHYTMTQRREFLEARYRNDDPAVEVLDDLHLDADMAVPTELADAAAYRQAQERATQALLDYSKVLKNETK